MIVLDIDKTLDAPMGKMRLSLQLEINKGELVTFYGSSGAGKTSTFRMLAGLMDPDSGMIHVDGSVWFDGSQGISIRPQDRNIGFVFQDYALFSNMTVKQNLEYALSKGQPSRIVSDLIDITELGALQTRKPMTLSGGQKQRVALARALVQQPDILLLDEPFSSLDAEMRHKLQKYLQKVHQEFNLTTLLISHDIGEIVSLSGDVIILDQGLVTRRGSPDHVFIDNSVSGKFKFIGSVLRINPQEVVFIVTVLVQSSIVKVVAQESEVKNLHVGDRVVVVSKAFNPMIYKI